MEAQKPASRWCPQVGLPSAIWGRSPGKVRVMGSYGTDSNEACVSLVEVLGTAKGRDL